MVYAAISPVTDEQADAVREASGGRACITRSAAGGSLATTRIGLTGRRLRRGGALRLARQTGRYAGATTMARVMATRSGGSGTASRRGREEMTRLGQAKRSSLASRCLGRGPLPRHLGAAKIFLCHAIAQAINSLVSREVAAISAAVTSSSKPTSREITGGRAIMRRARVRLCPTAAPLST